MVPLFFLDTNTECNCWYHTLIHVVPHWYKQINTCFQEQQIFSSMWWWSFCWLSVQKVEAGNYFILFDISLFKYTLNLLMLRKQTWHKCPWWQMCAYYSLPSNSHNLALIYLSYSLHFDRWGWFSTAFQRKPIQSTVISIRQYNATSAIHFTWSEWIETWCCELA